MYGDQLKIRRNADICTYVQILSCRTHSPVRPTDKTIAFVCARRDRRSVLIVFHRLIHLTRDRSETVIVYGILQGIARLFIFFFLNTALAPPVGAISRASVVGRMFAPFGKLIKRYTFIRNQEGIFVLR